MITSFSCCEVDFFIVQAESEVEGLDMKLEGHQERPMGGHQICQGWLRTLLAGCVMKIALATCCLGPIYWSSKLIFSLYVVWKRWLAYIVIKYQEVRLSLTLYFIIMHSGTRNRYMICITYIHGFSHSSCVINNQDYHSILYEFCNRYNVWYMFNMGENC